MSGHAGPWRVCKVHNDPDLRMRVGFLSGDPQRNPPAELQIIVISQITACGVAMSIAKTQDPLSIPCSFLCLLYSLFVLLLCAWLYQWHFYSKQHFSNPFLNLTSIPTGRAVLPIAMECIAILGCKPVHMFPLCFISPDRGDIPQLLRTRNICFHSVCLTRLGDLKQTRSLGSAMLFQ